MLKHDFHLYVNNMHSYKHMPWKDIPVQLCVLMAPTIY